MKYSKVVLSITSPFLKGIQSNEKGDVGGDEYVMVVTELCQFVTSM